MAEKEYVTKSSSGDTATIARIDKNKAEANLAVKELELKLALAKPDVELNKVPRNPDLVQAAQNIVITATRARDDTSDRLKNLDSSNIANKKGIFLAS